MKANILHISPNFNFVCGVSRHVFSLISAEGLKKEFNLFFITNGGDALQKLDKASINYSLMNFKTNKFLHFELLQNYRRLRKFCLEKKINIIHSHHRYPALLAEFVSRSIGFKTVITVHNFVTMFKPFSYKSDRVIAVSNSVKDHLIDYFKISEKKIDVLYNCVTDEKSNAVSENKITGLKIPADHKIILFAGRITGEKGISTLVDAFNSLTEEFNAVQLILLGENNLSQIQLSKISGNKKIHLVPSQENVSEFYNLADVVVLPSLKEPLGYAMLDSGFYKIPFIGSRAGGISEFIVDTKNGFLFEPGNANDLADKLKFVLTHKEESAQTAEALHKKVISECSCEKYFEKLSHIYSSLLIN